jgi:hypothetical protein
MNYFAGLDVSVKNTSVCIVDEMGKIVREVKVVSDAHDHPPPQLKKGTYPGSRRPRSAFPWFESYQATSARL